jgi:hypothetical protein
LVLSDWTLAKLGTEWVDLLRALLFPILSLSTTRQRLLITITLLVEKIPLNVLLRMKRPKHIIFRVLGLAGDPINVMFVSV